ncbi:MAG: hypothetical protein ACOYL5_17990 [Phototrophicaceae bacterium]
MTKYLLLANVGNSDIQYPREDFPHGKLPPPRQLVDYIRQDQEARLPKMWLPLLIPALHYIWGEAGLPPEKRDQQGQILQKEKDKELRKLAKDLELEIILFASDQQRDLVKPDDWEKDTKPSAELIQEFLYKRYEIPKKNIKIRTIDGSPADYANALQYLDEQTRTLAKNYPTVERVYLEIAGGTPAMTTMLLLNGVETFGERAVTLYIDRASTSADMIPVAAELHARETRENILEQMSLCVYGVAAKSAEANRERLSSDSKVQASVIQLLRYADRRLAFDYKRARFALEEASTHLRGTQQAQVRAWLSKLKEITLDEQVAELIYGAQIKVQLGEYADLTQRIFRFQEAVLRHMSEKAGVQYKADNKGDFVLPAWLNAAEQAPLLDYLKRYQRDSKGNPSPEVTPVDVNRAVNRYSLGALVEFYTRQPTFAHYQPTLELIFRLSGVADLRNKGIAGHGFEGFGKDDLEESYGDSVETLLNNLSVIYSAVFEMELPPSPYDQVNTLIRQLLEATG